MNNTKLALVIYTLCIFFGVPTQNFDLYHIQEPLTIAFEKTSLALAALKDTQEQEELPVLTFNTLSSESLSLPEEPKQVIVAQGPHTITVEEALTVDKNEIIMVQRQLDKDAILAKVVSNLNAPQINRLLQAPDVDQIVFSDWSQPSLDDEVKRIWNSVPNEDPTLEAIHISDNKGPFNEISLALDNKTQPTFIVSSGKLAPEETHEPVLPANLLARNNYTSTSSSYMDGIGINKNNVGVASIEPQAQVLKGTFEFTQGLGFLFGQQELQIVQELDGEVLAKGVINWNQAAFEIPIQQMLGDIKAVVLDREGFIVGSGEIPLNGLPTGTYELSGFHVPIGPKYNGLNLQTISAYSFDDYVEKAARVSVSDPSEAAIYTTDFEGRLENKLVQNGSTQNLQFKGKGYWTTTKYVEAGEKSIVPIFEDSMVSALLETLKEQGYTKGAAGNLGIIWGKIKNFKNAEGVQVQITDKEAFGPTYLNHVYLPQKNLFATSKNGYFIFVGVSPGVHSLSFNYHGKTFQRTAEVIRQNITYLDIELDSTIEQKITFADLDQKPSNDIQVYIPGAKLNTAPSNPIKVKTIKSSAYNIIEFKEATTDLVYRANLPSSEKNILIRYLNPYLLSKLINLNTFANATIGFVDSGHFTGIFLNKKELSQRQMFYFDSEARMIPHQQLNTRWQQVAGFIIYDIAEGTNSLQIFDDRGLVTQQEILIGNKTVHILPTW